MTVSSVLTVKRSSVPQEPERASLDVRADVRAGRLSGIGRRGMKLMTAPPQYDLGELSVFAETDEIAGLHLEGEFDMANAPLIIEQGERLLADDKQLIVDLSDATFIDSSVVTALFRLGAVARKNGRVIVLQLGTAAIVERVIEISNMERVFPRVSTRSEAIDTIRQLQRPVEY